jgi:hypothetical protein
MKFREDFVKIVVKSPKSRTNGAAEREFGRANLGG